MSDPQDGRTQHYCSHQPPCCPQLEEIRTLLATERDAFGKKETKLMAEMNSLCKRVEKLREALRRVIAVLGPEPVADCCEGALEEMSIAISISQDALQSDEREG